MELVRVLGKDPGPPPIYHVIFRVVADHGRHSCPSWLTEKLIYRACPGDPGAEGLLREFDASPRPAKRRRTAEPTEPREPAAPVELVEPVAQVEHVAQVAEATVAKRQVVGQPTSHYIGVSWCKDRRKWQAQIGHNSKVHHLGLFANEEVAGRAFDNVAWRFHGAKAHGTWKRGGMWRLNYPTSKEAAAVEDPAKAEAVAQAVEALVAKWWVVGHKQGSPPHGTLG